MHYILCYYVYNYNIYLYKNLQTIFILFTFFLIYENTYNIQRSNILILKYKLKIKLKCIALFNYAHFLVYKKIVSK